MFENLEAFASGACWALILLAIFRWAAGKKDRWRKP
jgi:hypothetical protein